MVVEQIAGQPYIAIRLDRVKIARYGLNVKRGAGRGRNGGRRKNRQPDLPGKPDF